MPSAVAALFSENHFDIDTTLLLALQRSDSFEYPFYTLLSEHTQHFAQLRDNQLIATPDDASDEIERIVQTILRDEEALTKKIRFFTANFINFPTEALLKIVPSIATQVSQASADLIPFLTAGLHFSVIAYLLNIAETIVEADYNNFENAKKTLRKIKIYAQSLPENFKDKNLILNQYRYLEFFLLLLEIEKSVQDHPSERDLTDCKTNLLNLENTFKLLLATLNRESERESKARAHFKKLKGNSFQLINNAIAEAERHLQEEQIAQSNEKRAECDQMEVDIQILSTPPDENEDSTENGEPAFFQTAFSEQNLTKLPSAELFFHHSFVFHPLHSKHLMPTPTLSYATHLQTHQMQQVLTEERVAQIGHFINPPLVLLTPVAETPNPALAQPAERLETLSTLDLLAFFLLSDFSERKIQTLGPILNEQYHQLAEAERETVTECFLAYFRKGFDALTIEMQKLLEQADNIELAVLSEEASRLFSSINNFSVRHQTLKQNFSTYPNLIDGNIASLSAQIYYELALRFQLTDKATACASLIQAREHISTAITLSDNAFYRSELFEKQLRIEKLYADINEQENLLERLSRLETLYYHAIDFVFAVPESEPQRELKLAMAWLRTGNFLGLYQKILREHGHKAQAHERFEAINHTLSQANFFIRSAYKRDERACDQDYHFQQVRAEINHAKWKFYSIKAKSTRQKKEDSSKYIIDRDYQALKGYCLTDFRHAQKLFNRLPFQQQREELDNYLTLFTRHLELIEYDARETQNSSIETLWHQGELCEQWIALFESHPNPPDIAKNQYLNILQTASDCLYRTTSKTNPDLEKINRAVHYYEQFLSQKESVKFTISFINHLKTLEIQKAYLKISSYRNLIEAISASTLEGHWKYSASMTLVRAYSQLCQSRASNEQLRNEAALKVVECSRLTIRFIEEESRNPSSRFTQQEKLYTDIRFAESLMLAYQRAKETGQDGRSYLAEAIDVMKNIFTVYYEGKDYLAHCKYFSRIQALITSENEAANIPRLDERYSQKRAGTALFEPARKKHHSGSDPSSAKSHDEGSRNSVKRRAWEAEEDPHARKMPRRNQDEDTRTAKRRY